MKINYLLKATPLLSTLLLIIVLGINNQKDYAKLRILIWNTPTLTLGSYLAISTGTGFILSYFITTKVASISKNSPNLKYKGENNFQDREEYKEADTNISYENTLFERDIKDPAPTINASFRIIGKKEGINSKFSNDDVSYFESSEYDDQYDEQSDDNATINHSQSITSDWNDESFSRW